MREPALGQVRRVYHETCSGEDTAKAGALGTGVATVVSSVNFLAHSPMLPVGRGIPDRGAKSISLLAFCCACDPPPSRLFFGRSAKRALVFSLAQRASLIAPVLQRHRADVGGLVRVSGGIRYNHMHHSEGGLCI